MALRACLAVAGRDGRFHGYATTDTAYPGSLTSLIARGDEALLGAVPRDNQGENPRQSG